MSNHQALVVPVNLEPHPNADSLSIVKVGGFTVVVRTDEWYGTDRGVYIEPDTLVDTKIPEFIFLNGHECIKVRKFRGIISQGLLIHAPDGSVIGEDMWERYGLSHYEPETAMSMSGDQAPAPENIHVPVYDVENLLKYNHLIFEGEPVYVTSKIHGSSWRAVYWRDELHVGSRNTWKKYDPNNMYWRVIEKYPSIREFLTLHKSKVLYGEVYGPKVQSLNYNIPSGNIEFAAFDLYSIEYNSYFLRSIAVALTAEYKIPWVYSYGDMTFNMEKLKEIAEQDDPIAGMNGVKQIQEGVVISPIIERFSPEIGRVKLKLISNRYYSAK